MIPISVQTVNSGKGPARNIDILQGVNASTKWEFDFSNSAVTRTVTLGTSPGNMARTQLTTTKSILLTPQGIEKIKAGTVHLTSMAPFSTNSPASITLHVNRILIAFYYIPALDKVAQSPFADCPEHPALPK